MFKFVVFAFVAAAVAEPEPAVLLPYAQPWGYSSLYSPGVTSISSQSSSVIHPSSITYSSPLAYSHFIKKRSADPQFLATTYGTPYSFLPSSYSYYSPAASVISTPTVYSSSIGSLPIAAHLIKKRSAQLLSTPYIAPTTYSYLDNAAISSVYSTPYLNSGYYGAHLPLANTHFIKKRSAEPTPEAKPQTFIPSYLTPSTYINAYSTPYLANPVVNSYYSSLSAYPYAHLIKKRSAEAAPEPAAEPAADPQLAYSTYGWPSYYSGSPLLPYSSATVYNAPAWSANPFLYSTLIKK